jgi:hypothetical protein
MNGKYPVTNGAISGMNDRKTAMGAYGSGF